MDPLPVTRGWMKKDDSALSRKLKEESKGTRSCHFFSIGIQGALEKVATSLAPGEHLCAFLDDVYLLCDRVVPVQVAQRGVGQGGSHQVAPRENQGVEPGRKSARGCPGPEAWRPQGLTDLETPITEFAVTEHERQDRGGASALGDQERVCSGQSLARGKCESQVQRILVGREQRS